VRVSSTLGSMSTKEIRTTIAHASCDVCGRTLLRGERAEMFVAAGGTRRAVCDLCTSRALHEGWIREGDAALGAGLSSGDGRRSLLGRFRSRREVALTRGAMADADADPAVAPPARPAQWPDPAASPPERPLREPRHVRAVPTSGEQRVVAAIETFNTTDHRRTIAGVARSLGAPSVSVLPSASRPSIVNIIAAWELCWYRYEVDLSDERPSVEVTGQGYELNELAADERTPTAVADEHGGLSLG
jgi:hypothetical protein